MRTIIALGLILLLRSSFCACYAQQMIPPEDIAGRWQAPDGKGGEIGMNILITTTVPSSTTDLVAASQTLHSLDVGVYHRSGLDVEATGFNFFRTSTNGLASWDGRHLRIDSQNRTGSPAIHLDLTWQSASHVWTGKMVRDKFQDLSVVLRRPAQHSNHNSFVGTWFESNGSMNNCLHIAEAADGSFTGWSDDIEVPGWRRYANGIKPMNTAIVHYGEIAKVWVTEPNRIRIEIRAYTAACCSHTMVATLSGDHNSLASPSQVPQPARWVRISSSSCRRAASRR